jgi:methylase of polypeptide subunit release factors
LEFLVVKNEYKYVMPNDQELIIDLAKGVFHPTGTSEVLIDAVSANIEQPGKLLDLGCGSGLVGIVLSLLGKCAGRLYASDLSEQAVELLKLNSNKLDLPVIVKQGSIYAPWEGERFDYIVNDISGIAEDIAKLSDWFKETSCEAGLDGTKLVNEAISKAPNFLNEGGKFYFPVLSFSNVTRILDHAGNVFNNVERLSQKKWVLPDDLKPYMSELAVLKELGYIDYEEKFGLIIWYTDIYVATSPILYSK